MPNLALFRHEKGPLNPLTFGSIFSSGTLTSSMKIMPVGEALKENLPSILGADNPGIPFSKMNPLSPSSWVLAHMIKTSATGLASNRIKVRKNKIKDYISKVPVGDPVLTAIECVSLGGFVILGRGLHPGGVRPVVGLRQTEAADYLTLQKHKKINEIQANIILYFLSLTLASLGRYFSFWASDPKS